jgi:hypothetical protein
MTNIALTRAAAVSAIAAGLIFVLVQFLHPDETVANVTTSTWKIVHALYLLITILALIGIIGIYLRQIREMRKLGLVGTILFGGGFLIIYAFIFIELTVLPELVDTEPQYVTDVMRAVAEGEAHDIGGLAVANSASAFTYVLGGILFGLAVFRARVLARWASALLVIGGLSTILIPFLPHSLDRLVAIPTGVGLAGLGLSLWQRPSSRGESLPTTRIASSSAQT